MILEMKTVPRIVIGDNNSQDRILLAGYLKAKRLNVVEAENTGELLLAVDDFRPDLIILAENMRLLNGFQVCEMLRETRKKQKLRIMLLLETYSQPKMYKAMTVGADAVFVRKDSDDLESLFPDIESYITTSLLERAC